jgi:hypothetical protein
MTIIEALGDARFFKPVFGDLESWRAWLVYLRALFGLPIVGKEDLDVLRGCTGLEAGPAERARESFVICGRRSGKSTIAALIAVYLATFRDWGKVLKPGETGWIFILAVDRYQARIIKNYVRAMLEGSPHFRKLIARERQEEIELTNRVSIAVKTSSYRGVRGFTVLAAILEELGFWRSEESANPDKEVIAALRPALATVPDSLLIGISTPYTRTGVLYDMFKNHFAKRGAAPLIWKAPTQTMNPTVDKRLIEMALAEDPAAARAEWEAEWRQDIEAFLPLELVEAVTVPGRFELPKVEGGGYVAFCDPSGGRSDSFTLGIAHEEKSGKIVLDVLRERRPPFSPSEVVKEYADTMKGFGVDVVGADRYAGEWVTEAFAAHGIRVQSSELSASELYAEILPLVANGSVELLDSKRLAAQLTQLERRTRMGGKDLVTHGPGGHDDLANAAAGAVVSVAREGRRPRVRITLVGKMTREEIEEAEREEEEERRRDAEEGSAAGVNFEDEDDMRAHGWRRWA